MRDANEIPMPAELLAIAERLGFATLEARSDRRDFREVAVWMVRDALKHAYEAGRRAAPPEPPPWSSMRCECPDCSQDIDILIRPTSTTKHAYEASRRAAPPEPLPWSSMRFECPDCGRDIDILIRPIFTT